jgi:uncharacterized protein (DUF58 family)
MKTLRVTPSGVGLGVGALATIGAGLFGRYRELIVLGALAVILVVAMILLPRLRAGVTINRRLRRVLVQRGDPITARVLVKADGDRSAAVTLIDQLGGRTVTIDVPSLSEGQEFEAKYQWSGLPRGVYEVGPVREEQTDAFGLTVRASRHDLIDQVLIHPLVHKLGRASDMVTLHQQNTPFRSVSDDPLADLRALREYQPGDDPRLIHWPSTARIGTLVVRDFLDLRQNARLVLLDASDATLTASEFEEAVEIAASLAACFLEAGLITVVRTTDPDAAGTDKPIRNRTELLEVLTRVRRVPPANALNERRLLRTSSVSGSIHVVCGPRSALVPTLLSASALRSRVSVVRVCSRRLSTPLRVPTLDVETSVEFARRWRLSL